MLKMLKIFIPLSQYLGPTSTNSYLKKMKTKPYIEYTCSPALKQAFGNCHLPTMLLMALIKCASRPWAIKALKIYVKANDSALNQAICR